MSPRTLLSILDTAHPGTSIEKEDRKIGLPLLMKTSPAQTLQLDSQMILFGD
jgi:hypothetical protein